MNELTKFLIVEDDLLIAETIREILNYAGYKNTYQAQSVDEAISLIETKRPDMVLSDIELGHEKNGIDLGILLQLKYKLPFIYITSHTSADILNRAKHTQPNAYIIKPFKNEDLLVAIELALFNTSLGKGEQNTSGELILKEGRALVRIDTARILWLENENNYTTINLSDNKRRVIRSTLAELFEQLPHGQFIRIHKSFIINKKHVGEIHPGSLIIGEREFPIGKTYQQEVKEFFSL